MNWNKLAPVEIWWWVVVKTGMNPWIQLNLGGILFFLSFTM
jgi:hypothetical protein